MPVMTIWPSAVRHGNDWQDEPSSACRTGGEMEVLATRPANEQEYCLELSCWKCARQARQTKVDDSFDRLFSRSSNLILRSLTKEYSWA
jgi:hypothetical protein